MKCWKVVRRPTYEKVMHTRFVSLRKKPKQGRVCSHKARLVVCDNERTDYKEDAFTMVSQHLVSNFLLSLFIQ